MPNAHSITGPQNQTFRVTYTDSLRREALIEATDKETALQLAREQSDNTDLHEVIDGWTDNWQVEIS